MLLTAPSALFQICSLKKTSSPYVLRQEYVEGVLIFAEPSFSLSSQCIYYLCSQQTHGPRENEETVLHVETLIASFFVFQREKACKRCAAVGS